MQYLNVPGSRCPEVIVPAEDYRNFERVMLEVTFFESREYLVLTSLCQAPGNKYAKGFNEEVGDKGVLFRLS